MQHTVYIGPIGTNPTTALQTLQSLSDVMRDQSKPQLGEQGRILLRSGKHKKQKKQKTPAPSHLFPPIKPQDTPKRHKNTVLKTYVVMLRFSIQ